jgi:DNA-binding MarR family transcriptional regulator
MNTSIVEPLTGDDEALLEQALPLLPEIGKLLYAAVLRHPGAAGLSLPQIKATGWLAHHGRCTVGEIAAGIGASLPSTSELVDGLVQRGLAERGTNPADRRQVLVWLTPEGARLKRAMRDLRSTQVRNAIARLAPEERPVFVRSLEALVAALREDDAPPPAPS